MSKLLECWICGKPHDYCPTCGQTHGWKYVACCPEHYQVHMIIEAFRGKALTEDEAIEAFANKCNVRAENDLSWMQPHVEKCVREIIGEKGQPIESAKMTKRTKKSKLY